jgi:hypothetical protein
MAHAAKAISDLAMMKRAPAMRLRWGSSSMSKRAWLLTRSMPSKSTLPRKRCNGASHGSVGEWHLNVLKKILCRYRSTHHADLP